MPKPSSINLIRKPVNLFDSFINWALTIGRVVVIVTELVALAAFLYRFSLDRQLIDLHSKIKQEVAVVNYLKENEEKYRNLQNRLALASSFGEQGNSKVKLANDLINFSLAGVVLNNLSIQEDRIRINANLSSVSTLSSFVNSLKEYPTIQRVLIDKIENKSSSAVITVSITAILEPDKINANTE